MKYLSLILFIFLLFNIPSFGQNCECLSIFDTCFPTKNYSTVINNYLTKVAEFELKDDYQSAHREISEAIAIEPNLAILYLRRARVSIKLKKIENVFQDVQTAISFKLDNEKAWRDFLGEFGEKNYKEEKLKIFEMLISSENLRYLGYSLRTVFNNWSQDYAEFVEDRIKSLEFFPLDGTPDLTPLSVILEGRLKKHPNYLEYSLRVLDLLEQRAKYYSQNSVKIRFVRNCKEEFIEVSDALGKLLLDQAHDFILFIQRTYQQQGQIEKEIETIKRINRFESKENAYYFRLRLFAYRKYYKEAIEDATFLIDLNKTQPERQAAFMLYRGDLFVLANQYDQAIKDYKTAVLLNPKTEPTATKKIEETKQKLSKTTK